MWQRDNLFKEIVFIIQAGEELKVFFAANTDATIGFKSKLELFFDIADDKRNDRLLQGFVVIIIHVDTVPRKAQWANGGGKIIAVKFRRPAIAFNYLINKFC